MKKGNTEPSNRGTKPVYKTQKTEPNKENKQKGGPLSEKRAAQRAERGLDKKEHADGVKSEGGAFPAFYFGAFFSIEAP